MQSRLVIQFVLLWKCCLLVISEYKRPALLPQINVTELNGTTKGACAYQCIDLDQNAFHECMKSCYDRWIFKKGDNRACLTADPSSFNSSGIACNPTRLEGFELRHILPSGEVNSFLYLTWMPCYFAIDTLRGFVVDIGYGLHSQCINNELVQTLSNTERDQNVQFLFLTRLSYNKQYVMILRAYPYDSTQRGRKLKFTTPTCHDLNGPRSCFCDRDMLPPPNVTQHGYGVEVSFYPAKSCFNVKSYTIELHLCVPGWSCHFLPLFVKIEHSKGNRSLITHRFTKPKLYDSDDHPVTVIVVSNYEQGHRAFTSNTTLKLQAWSPPLLEVSLLAFGAVEVSFELSTVYDISTFEIRLNNITVEDGSNNTIKPLRTDVIHVGKNRHGNFTKEYYLRNGRYGVQIREVRKESEFSNPTKWGPMRTFYVEPGSDPVKDEAAPSIQPYVTIAGVAAGVVLVILIGFLYCYFRRTNRPIKHEPVDESSSSRNSALIIWPEDNRSEALTTLQKELIKSFVQFLASVGVDASVDLMEPSDLNTNSYERIVKPTNTADWIVFVCPYSSDASSNQQHLTGNFSRACEYLVNQGLESKFVTVVFPHANLDVSSDAVYLRRISAIFLLMDKINGVKLQAHPEGLAMTNLRHFLPRVNCHEYIRSAPGEALMEALLKLKEEIEKYDADRKPIICKSDDDVAIFPEPVAESSPNGYCHPSSSCFRVDVSHFDFSNTNDFSRDQQLRYEPKATQTKHPRREMLQHHRLTNHTAYPTTCPMRNVADSSTGDSLSSREPCCRVCYSHEASYLHAQAFGEECSLCDGETNPKSPMEPEQENRIGDNSINIQLEPPYDSGIYSRSAYSDASNRSSIA